MAEGMIYIEVVPNFVTFEFLARALAFEDRLRLFRALTSALVELTDPIALYSGAADAFFEPRRWLVAVSTFSVSSLAADLAAAFVFAVSLSFAAFVS